MEPITSNELESKLSLVRDGAGILVVATTYRQWQIDAKALAKTPDAITRSKDGRGFLLQNGKRKDYVFPGYVFFVEV